MSSWGWMVQIMFLSFHGWFVGSIWKLSRVQHWFLFNLGFASSMREEKVPKIFSQMVVAFDSDEFHGIRNVKKSPKKHRAKRKKPQNPWDCTRPKSPKPKTKATPQKNRSQKFRVESFPKKIQPPREKKKNTNSKPPWLALKSRQPPDSSEDPTWSNWFCFGVQKKTCVFLRHLAGLCFLFPSLRLSERNVLIYNWDKSPKRSCKELSFQVAENQHLFPKMKKLLGKLSTKKTIPSLKLTVRTYKWWFPIGISPFQGVYFQGRAVSFREGNS